GRQLGCAKSVDNEAGEVYPSGGSIQYSPVAACDNAPVVWKFALRHRRRQRPPRNPGSYEPVAIDGGKLSAAAHWFVEQEEDLAGRKFREEPEYHVQGHIAQ